MGFVSMVLGALLVACAAALPVTADRQDAGVVAVRFRMDGCGPAIRAALRDTDPACQDTARRRLLITTTTGLAMVVVGLVMFAGGDSRGSRVNVATPTGRWRPPARSRGSRRCTPG